MVQMGDAVGGGGCVEGVAAIHVCEASTRLLCDACVGEVVESPVL